MNIHVEDESAAGMRLDRYLSEIVGVATRNQLSHRAKNVRVNDLPSKFSKRLAVGDTITFELEEAPVPELEPQELPLSILFENEAVIVVDKDQGMVVHPGAGHHNGTLVNALLGRLHEFAITDDQPSLRPGIVHRLDKETSGVLIVAKDVESLDYLSNQFAERKTEKIYLALAKNVPSRSWGMIESPIRRDPRNRIKFTSKQGPESRSGKKAVTVYRVLQTFKDYALVLLTPKTGRTHQLRVHMHDLGCPILGDPLYARRDSLFPDATLMLHAYSLTIRIPPSGRPATFRAPVPERFRTVLRSLRQSRNPSTSAR